MYVAINKELSRQHREEIMHEVAIVRVEKTARENRQASPYVVRDLSWELARYLDADTASASASATSRSAGANLRKSA